MQKKVSMKRYRNKYNGFILMNKPVGISSHDVIDRLRDILEQKKIGHTGTLDVQASGLMIICLGRATKASQFVLDLGKAYDAEITLGMSSPTYDSEGIDENQKPAPLKGITQKKIEKAVEKFVGEFEQTVPLYSAVRVNGERMYKLARKGVKVDLPTRPVKIQSIKVNSYEKPTLNISVDCSSGTYIRSLAHDLGQELGCGAYLSNLVRTRIGDQTIDDAFSFEEVEHLHTRKRLELFVLNYGQVLNYSGLKVPTSLARKVVSGKAVYVNEVLGTEGDFEKGDKIVIKDNYGKVMAVGMAESSSDEIRSQSSHGKLFKYIRVFH